MTRVSRNQRELLRQLDAAALSLFKQAQSLTPLAGVYGVDSDWMRPAFAEYGASVGYDQGVIRNDRYNDNVHGRVSSNSLELFARGKHVSTSVTFAHSLERPGGVTEREAPIYFRMDFFL